MAMGASKRLKRPVNKKDGIVGFPELVNDIFSVVSCLQHGSDLLICLFPTFGLDLILRAESAGHEDYVFLDDSNPC